MSDKRPIIEEVHTGTHLVRTESLPPERDRYVTVYAVLAYGEAREATKVKKILNKYGLRIAAGLYLVPSAGIALHAAEEARKALRGHGRIIPISMSIPAQDMVKILIDAASNSLSEPISDQEAVRRLTTLTALMDTIARQTNSRGLSELSNLFAQLIYVAGAALSKPKIVKQVRSMLATLKKKKMVAI